MKMIKRKLQAELKTLLKEYPVVTLLGPRQAGKTTLARTLEYSYYNLEDPQTRTFAAEDPKAFLMELKTPVILDEIQRLPSLLSEIQVLVDESNKNGQFILTGSHQPELTQAITQSLAGRIGILNLFPLSIPELVGAGIEYNSFQDYIHRGFLPRVHNQSQRPSVAYSNYYRTYIERDVRQLLNLRNQGLFEKFIHLLAGRVGQVINHSSLARDVGVGPKTITDWLSLLEASFIIYRLPPYFKNFGKRAIKSPKYYFTEVGLLAFLLGIRRPNEITRDPLVGAMFENLVVIECLKFLANQGEMPQMYFFRDSNGNEVDLLIQRGTELRAFEIKSASTYHPSMLEGLHKIKKVASHVREGHLVYNGKSLRHTQGSQIIHFKKIHSLL